MKNLLLLLTFISTSIISVAQNCNAVFFTQDGTKFQVVLNGILQNQDFDTNVKVTGLSYDAGYKVTINFEDRGIAPLNKSIFMMEDNSEFSYEITRNRKGVLVLRVGSVVPIAQAPKTPKQSEVSYTTTAPTSTQVQSNVGADVQITETTTTTTTKGANGENISMGINMGELGMNVNVNINDDAFNTGGNVQTTTKTTVTTTSSQSGNFNTNTNQTTAQQPLSIREEPKQGCFQAASSTDFNNGVNSIKKQSFTDSQMKVAKTFTRNNCLSVNQIKKVMEIFSFEDSKLEYAKFAYDFCVDKNNYFQLSDAFKFSSSSDDLNDFLDTK